MDGSTPHPTAFLSLKEKLVISVMRAREEDEAKQMTEAKHTLGPWSVYVSGERTGEDVFFFNDVRAAGFDVWLDPSIELGHVGEHEWRGRFADTITKPKETVSDGNEIGW